MESGDFLSFPRFVVCQTWRTLQIQVLCHAASVRTLYCSEMCLFCKIDKIMFADSEHQDRKRYFMKI